MTGAGRLSSGPSTRHGQRRPTLPLLHRRLPTPVNLPTPAAGVRQLGYSDARPRLPLCWDCFGPERERRGGSACRTRCFAEDSSSGEKIAQLSWEAIWRASKKNGDIDVCHRQNTAFLSTRCPDLRTGRWQRFSSSLMPTLPCPEGQPMRSTCIHRSDAQRAFRSLTALEAIHGPLFFLLAMRGLRFPWA